jgi:hypothetical protein
MVYVRMSCLAGPAPRLGKIHLYPLSSLCQELVRTLPPPQGQNAPVNVYALSTPISVLFWVSERTKRNQYWQSFNHCLPEFDGPGGGPPSSNFLHFASRN